METRDDRLASETPEELTRPDLDERARKLLECREYATVLSWVQREVYTDVLSFGSFLEAHAGGSDAPLEALKRSYGALATLRASLRDLREPYLRAQRERLGERLEADDLQVQLGARERDRPGWLTIDLQDADLEWNVTWGLPLADGQCKYVYTSHLLEHLYAPEETLGLLTEIHRVLKPGGVVRIVVPDMERYFRAYIDGEEEFFTESARDAPPAQQRMTPLIRSLEWAGHNTRGDCFLAHKTGFDHRTLDQALRRAGFSLIERASPGQSHHPGLCLDSPHIIASGSSLFVEAIREELSSGT